VRLVFSDLAVSDLTRLRTFIAANDPTAAQRIAVDLIARIDMIARFPEMGKPVARSPEPDVHRDVVFGPYVIRYGVHSDSVVILRIWHVRENR
jgi:plasmid stabilization system protein ParE